MLDFFPHHFVYLASHLCQMAFDFFLCPGSRFSTEIAL